MTTILRAVLGGAIAMLASQSPVFAQTTPGSGEVNVYTTREPGLIQPLLDAFTEGDRHQGQRDLHRERPRRARRGGRRRTRRPTS